MTTGVGFRSERGPILIALMLSTGLIALDTTVLGTAVPSIVADLGGFNQFPWLFSSYLLTSAVTTPVYSKLADLVGRRPMLIFGITVFLVASLLCGLAWNMPALIAFRALQGVGAGAIMPISITILGDIYTVPERARIQGYMSSVWAVASILGPAVGGTLSQVGAWRLVFFINVPLCLVAACLVMVFFKEEVERRRHRVDVAGAVLLTAGMTLLILALLEGGQAWRWNSWQSIAAFVGGGSLLVAFVLVEQRVREPILPLWIFGRRLIVTALLVGVAVGAILMGIVGYVPIYLEGSLGVTPVVAGVALAGFLFAWPFSTAFAGRSYLKIGFRNTTVVGFALTVVGASALTFLAHTPTVVGVAATSFVLGFGLGMATVSPLVAAQASVEWRERGVVTGANVFARSIGSAVGVAVFGAMANAVFDASDLADVDTEKIIAGAFAVFLAVTVTAVAGLAVALAMPRAPRR